jgi:hypothetical protein
MVKKIYFQDIDDASEFSFESFPRSQVVHFAVTNYGALGEKQVETFVLNEWDVKDLISELTTFLQKQQEYINENL